MLSSHRVLTLLAASGAVAAVAMPVAALAHGDGGGGGGGGGGRRSARSLSGPRRICRQVGVPLGGSSHGGLYANGNGRLTATQVADLQSACTQLKAALAIEQTEDGTAFTELQPALTQLNAACPRRHRHGGGHGRGPTGATGATGATGSTGVVAEVLPPTLACEEARNAFKTADGTYRSKRKQAAGVFDTALTDFDATVSAALGTGVTHGHHHHRGGSTGSSGWTGASGWSGPTGSSGSSGSSGSTGATGATAPALPTGPTGPGPAPGTRHHH